MSKKIKKSIKKTKIKLLVVWNWFKKLGFVKKGLVVGAILFISFLLFKPKKEDQKPSYQTARVEQGQVVQTVSETGVVMSTAKTDVTSTIKGVIKSVYVQNGQIVKKGAKLFEVTSSATDEERQVAYASYLSAKNTLNTAERNLYTFESDMWVEHEIYESRAIDSGLATVDPLYIETNRDWLAYEKKYIDQDQVVKQAKASISAKWLAYQATINGSVKAPITGTVANLNVAQGQYVDGTNVALIIGSGVDTWLELSVSESDVLKIKPKQNAQVKVDAIRGKTFDAVVERVDTYGTDNSGVVTYEVYLILTNNVEMIRPNMTVQVDIVAENKDNVLRVPSGAIKPYKGGKAVQVMGKGSRAMYKPVEIGIEGESYTEILKGLEVGEEVIVGENAGIGLNTGSGGMFSIGRMRSR